MRIVVIVVQVACDAVPLRLPVDEIGNSTPSAVSVIDRYLTLTTRSRFSTPAAVTGDCYCPSFAIHHHHPCPPDDEGRAENNKDWLRTGNLRSPGLQPLSPTVSPLPSLGIRSRPSTCMLILHALLERANATASSLYAVHVVTLEGRTRCVAADRAPLQLLTARRFSCYQCTWGRETAKKARTQQHFESLVNHIKSLEARVKELEGELSSSRSHTRRSGSVSDAARSVGSSSLSPHPSPITKFEPEDDSFLNGHDGTDSPSNSEDDSEIDQLIAPTRHLVVSANWDIHAYMQANVSSSYKMATWSSTAQRLRTVWHPNAKRRGTHHQMARLMRSKNRWSRVPPQYSTGLAISLQKYPCPVPNTIGRALCICSETLPPLIPL